MRINIGYDTKSIDKALKQIEEYQKKVQGLIPTFLQRCAERIIKRANERLVDEGNALGLSSVLIREIQNGWQPPTITQTATSATALLENTADKAVYIEFGVGQLGAFDSHAEAIDAGYSYDINGHGQNGWKFWVRGNKEIDIGEAFRDKEIRHRDNAIEIYTRGQPATMFAFQALMDFRDNKEFVPIMENLLKGLE